MPHVSFVTLSGFRVHEPEMLALGMSLPGLRQRGEAIAELPSLGLLTLAGMTPEPWTRSWHSVEQCDETAVETILAQRPALVAISALSASIKEAYKLSGDLRRHGVQTVIGGLHVSARPDEAAAFCDSVVVGEGEPVWHNVLADSERGQLRTTYRSVDVQVTSESQQWPMPQYDLLGPNPPRFTLQTQRGCPFACDFCAASRLISPFREKPAARIAEELTKIKGLARRPLIELADDNTFAGSRNMDEFFGVLASAGVRYFTEADWRIGERRDVLAGLADSGCVQVLVGLESLVFRYPGMGAKHSELARMMNAVCAIQDSGVAVNGCFIVGADGETNQSLDALTEFLLECPLADIQVTLQTPFPGTELYRRLQQSGRLLSDNDWPRYTLFDVTYQPDQLTATELAHGFRRVVSTVFSTAANQRRQAIRREIVHRRRNRSHVP